MDEYGTTYAPREIETTVVEHIVGLLKNPTATFGVGALTAPRGYYAKNVLLDGVVPRLNTMRIPVAEIDGTWHPSALVQYCRSPREVPEVPPPPDSAVKYLLFTTTDIGEIPPWITAEGPPDARTFPVGPLSLIEAHDLVTAQLGNPIEISNLQRLATLAGWVPAALSGLVRECQVQAGLELVNGYWRLLGDPVELAMLPYIRSQLAAAPLDVAAALMRIALSEPVALGELSAAEAQVGAELLRDGELHRVEGGTVRFAAPAVADALRRLSPWQEQRAAYERAIDRGTMTAPIAQWARQNRLPVPVGLLEAAAHAALHRHEWHDVLALVDVAQSATCPAASTPQLHLWAAQAGAVRPERAVGARAPRSGSRGVGRGASRNHETAR